MEIYRTEAVVSTNRTLTIEGVPFDAGDKVEVIVRVQEEAATSDNRYPLRGKSIRLVEPFESVAENEWNALQ
jgi:hypothetical protein